MDISRIGNTNETKLSSSDKIDRDNEFRQIFERKLTEIDATTIETSVGSKTDVIEYSNKILKLWKKKIYSKFSFKEEINIEFYDLLILTENFCAISFIIKKLFNYFLFDH